MGKVKKSKLKNSEKAIAKSTDIPSTSVASKKKLKKKSLKRKLADEEVEDHSPMEDVDEKKAVGVPEGDDSEDMDDEELSGDEEGEGDDGVDDDLMANETEEKCDFDFEAFPMEQDDKSGIVNMLTQIFLRADVDTVGMAEEIIKQSPFGNVVGPAVDQSDEDVNENVVYGLLTALPLDPRKDESPKYVKNVVEFLLQRVRKFAAKEDAVKFEELLKTRLGFLINERMLNFPTQIVAPSFSSLSVDLAGLRKPYKHVLYIQKMRIADATAESSDAKDTAASTSSAPEKKKKKKMGKAQKKRAALAARANAEFTFDNVEDEELLQLSEGTAYHFDYPVHTDVEPGSKFHIMEKDGKKFKPYRRAVIMDSERFNAFVKKLSSMSFE